MNINSMLLRTARVPPPEYLQAESYRPAPFCEREVNAEEVIRQPDLEGPSDETRQHLPKLNFK